jgi:hypothetical protein
MLIRLFLLFIFLQPIWGIAGVCKLPIPDGGAENYRPTHSNIDGVIQKISDKKMIIQDRRKKQSREVVFEDGKTQTYSAFGGDFKWEELREGTYVWIWFTNCKENKTAVIPVAAYVQLYSKNPSDQPNRRILKRGW